MRQENYSENYRKLTQDEIKKIEFALLTEFASYCDDHRFRYLPIHNYLPDRSTLLFLDKKCRIMKNL